MGSVTRTHLPTPARAPLDAAAAPASNIVGLYDFQTRQCYTATFTQVDGSTRTALVPSISFTKDPA